MRECGPGGEARGRARDGRAWHPLRCRRAGVETIDHADQLSAETMSIMKEKQIYAVPTFSDLRVFR